LFQTEEIVMDIRFLQSLVSVVELGSIAAAARQQNLTATAISQRIKALEEQLNCSLLSRIGHHASPTQACYDILPRVKQMISDSQQLRADINHLSLVGELRLGTIPSALTAYVPVLVKTFSKTAPQAQLVITPGASADLYERLIERKLDAALMIEPPFSLPKQFQTTNICTQPLCIVSKHPLKGDINEILASEPLILFDRKTWGGKSCWQWLVAQNTPFTTLCEIDAFETMIAMVQAGLGITIVPSWHGLQLYKGIFFRDIDPQTLSRNVILCAQRSCSVQNLITLSKQALSDIH
jgi:DNA-binding transcriptional LysR family regulator